MEKQKFQDVGLPRRAEKLESTADAIETMTYMKELSADEIAFHKDRFSQYSIELSKMNDDLKKFKDAMKEKMKPLQDELKISLSNIKLKAVEKTGRVYRYTDQETKTTGYYDEAGRLIKERPMTEDEQQLTIASMKKTGTNN